MLIRSFTRSSSRWLISASLLGSLVVTACGGGGSSGDGDGDTGDGDGDGDASGGTGSGDGDEGAGGAPVDYGTFEGLTGFAQKVSMSASAECSLGADGVAVCEQSGIVSDPPAIGLEKIASGRQSTCGLDAMGTLYCWGDDDGPGVVPGPLTAIGVGDEVACGARPNGALECWGDEENEAISPPAGTYSDVVVYGEGACALVVEAMGSGLTVQGGMTCWGQGFNGNYYPGDFVKMSLWGGRVCALTADGAIECPSGPALDGLAPGPYRDVAVGSNLVCAITTEGIVSCNGSSELSRLEPPAGDWDQIAVHDRDACVWSSDGTRACWGINLGDGASDLMCERHQALLSGTRDGGAMSVDLELSNEGAGFNDVFGFRFVYQTSVADPWNFGLMVVDGDEEYGSYPLSGLPEESVSVAALSWYDGATETAPGEFYCSASGSTLERVSDEVLVTFANLHALGGCEEGTPVSGGIEHADGDGTTNTIDGLASDSPLGGLGGGYNPDDGSGSAITTMNDGGILKIRWGAGGDVAWAVYVSPRDGDLGGATYCSTTGTVLGFGGGSDTTVSLSNFYEVPACPADATTDSVQGCVR